jgi:hypothetical protein
MSQNQQALPDPRQAYVNLMDGVAARVFFEKLAAAGITCNNQQEARELVELAGYLRSDAAQTKAASSRYGAALDDLRYVLEGPNGVDRVKAAAAQDLDVAMRRAAAGLAQDPTLYNSVLAIKAAEADALATG